MRGRGSDSTTPHSYLPLTLGFIGCEDDEESCDDGSENLHRWETRGLASTAITFFAALVSLAYVFLNEQKLLSKFTMSTVFVALGATAAGYCFGRAASDGERRPSVIKRGPSADTQHSASMSFQHTASMSLDSAEGRMKKKRAELQGVADESGWLEEYLLEEDENSGRRRSWAAEPEGAELSFSRRPSLQEMRETFDISEEVRTFLGSVEWNLSIPGYSKLNDVSGRPILGMGLYMMQHHQLVESLPDWVLEVSKDRFQSRLSEFLFVIDSKYLENPYHNGSHACDVMKMVKCLFSECEMIKSMQISREWMYFISIIAAAIHDMGHPGQTNNYHIAVRSELALLYNDKSPLEQMHVSNAFQIMNDSQRTDWFSWINKEIVMKKEGASGAEDTEKTLHLQSRIRKTLISMVLATDNLQHNALVDKVKKLMNRTDIKGTLESKYDMQLVMLETILHAADISHPTYDLDLHVYWSGQLMEEFWAQGDLEKMVLGDASMPMFDRDKMNVPGSQIGFFKFIALGLWEPLSILLPETECRLEQMKNNLEFWEKCKEENVLDLPPIEYVSKFVPQKFMPLLKFVPSLDP